MSAFGIANVKTYLGLQRSDNLNPVYVGIWLAFAECRPESPGLFSRYLILFLNFWSCRKNSLIRNTRLISKVMVS